MSNLNDAQFQGMLEEYAATRASKIWSEGDPCEVSGFCEGASRDFAAYARTKGYEDADAVRASHLVPSRTPAEHVVAKVGDRTVDWTFRQFDRDAPVPRVLSMEQSTAPNPRQGDDDQPHELRPFTYGPTRGMPAGRPADLGEPEWQENRTGYPENRDWERISSTPWVRW